VIVEILTLFNASETMPREGLYLSTVFAGVANIMAEDEVTALVPMYSNHDCDAPATETRIG